MIASYKDKLAERLRIALKKSGVTKKQIERKMGVSYTAVQKWFKEGSINNDNLMQLSAILNVDKAWLMSGEQSTGVREFLPGDEGDRDVLIPVYDVQLSAGNGMTAPEYIETKKKLPFDQNWLQKHRLKPSDLIVLYVAGDSMNPTMEDGDSVLIDKSKTKIIDRKVYAVVIGGECKIKRLSQRFDGSVEVISDNPQHRTETIPSHELEHLYVIGQAVYRSGML
jgi:phage repressor protein C with HTH and peptisase S24 domain